MNEKDYSGPFDYSELGSNKLWLDIRYFFCSLTFALLVGIDWGQLR